MESAEITEPLGLVHPRAANLAVLSTSPNIEATELTPGTLHLRLLRSGPAAAPVTLSLRVDGCFVTCASPLAFGTTGLREALDEALPEGCLLLCHPAGEALVVTITRGGELEAPPRLFCTSLDASLRARKVGPNRVLLRGVARGNGELRLRVDAQELRFRPTPGATPMAVAEQLRTHLQDSHIALLAVPDAPDGEVTVTVLRRR
jgi:hypothetical protein